jgi:hypothetical protein
MSDIGLGGVVGVSGAPLGESCTVGTCHRYRLCATLQTVLVLLVLVEFAVSYKDNQHQRGKGIPTEQYIATEPAKKYNNIIM